MSAYQVEFLKAWIGSRLDQRWQQPYETQLRTLLRTLVPNGTNDQHSQALRELLALRRRKRTDEALIDWIEGILFLIYKQELGRETAVRVMGGYAPMIRKKGEDKLEVVPPNFDDFTSNPTHVALRDLAIGLLKKEKTAMCTVAQKAGMSLNCDGLEEALTNNIIIFTVHQFEDDYATTLKLVVDGQTLPGTPEPHESWYTNHPTQYFMVKSTIMSVYGKAIGEAGIMLQCHLLGGSVLGDSEMNHLSLASGFHRHVVNWSDERFKLIEQSTKIFFNQMAKVQEKMNCALAELAVKIHDTGDREESCGSGICTWVLLWIRSPSLPLCRGQATGKAHW